MKTRFVRWCGAALLPLVLSACAGGPVLAQDAPFTSPNGLTAGYGNLIQRDAMQASGGKRGWVNTATTAHTVAGPEITGFEWVSLSILDNHARAGENVASYHQANKYGTGPTWAAVSEVADLSGAPSGLVAHEFDVWTTGPDTGNRIGLDITLGDVKAIRQGSASQIIEGSSAIRIGAANQSALPRWTRGIDMTGRYQVGIDLASATTETAIRIADGQSIALEQTGQIRISYTGGRIRFMNGSVSLFEIDTSSGDHYRLGQRTP